LSRVARRDHALGMFVVSEADAAVLRTAWEQGGELGAVVELRRLFPGIRDNARAAVCAAIVAGWKPLKLLDGHQPAATRDEKCPANCVGEAESNRPARYPRPKTPIVKHVSAA
jgi:hypothetical protein